MRFLTFILVLMSAAFAQPTIEPGVSHDLAKWRAEHYSDVRYKLNLTLEKMSPVLKGTIEVRVNVRDAGTSKNPPLGKGGMAGAWGDSFIVLDWRKIRGYEERSAVSNVFVNGKRAENHPGDETSPPLLRKEGSSARPFIFIEQSEHLIFSDGVVVGENVIKLDFTSPILTSGSAITRYVDKEDGAEYIYSLFVPSDASTAFPVFDQPDLKARFSLSISAPKSWRSIVSNAQLDHMILVDGICGLPLQNPGTMSKSGDVSSRNAMAAPAVPPPCEMSDVWSFKETKPISTYVFAFAAGPWQQVPSDCGSGISDCGSAKPSTSIYVRRSQATKFQPHSKDVFRLTHEAIRYFEDYFDYKFPFPKYDVVLIPEFPFGGMEHAGATFLREASVIFPQEPTKNDHINRATLIFHEAAHQWFGDTVTMRWFDDLWLKEGFATFTAYKAMEKIMPEMNSWKVFYERIKQGAYQTDSTKGTTAIYQPIPNLSAAKSAYGNIVYNKAPGFLRQAEFYLGEEKFRAAVRAFLKKHEFGNATWEDLVKEFEAQAGNSFDDMSEAWIKQPGMWKVRMHEGRVTNLPNRFYLSGHTEHTLSEISERSMMYKVMIIDCDGKKTIKSFSLTPVRSSIMNMVNLTRSPCAVFPNYGDYGYGIFLLDDKSRGYVLKNIQNETDPFLRSMMWGALWDSVREAELDPKEYVELAIRNLPTENDETITASVLGRVSTAINYYLGDTSRAALMPPLEQMLEREMLNGTSVGRRITFYRGFLNVGGSMRAREIYKDILYGKFWPKPAVMRGLTVGDTKDVPIKTKDRFDIVTKLASLNDPDADKLLTELEKTETSDDAKRYAYAARAAFPTKETKEKYWNDFVNNKEISESWIEAAFGPFNSVRQADLTLPYLESALKELPNHKRNRKIFFVNGWLAAFIGGQKSEEALAIVNKFLADNPNLDRDLRLKILENVDVIERAVKIRSLRGVEGRSGRSATRGRGDTGTR